MILEGEIKDAKLSSFSSDLQTLIKHSLHDFPLYFLCELLMSLRRLFLCVKGMYYDNSGY